jgi:hypothetical protein
MKWLFLLLLLINVGLFMWIFPQRSPPEPTPAPIPGVKRLVLLNELSEQELEQLRRAEVQRRNGLKPGEAGPDDKPRVSQSSTIEAADAMENAADRSEEERALLATTETDQSRPTQSLSKDIVTPLLDDGSIAPEQLASATAAKPAQATGCTRIGPLNKRNQADRLVQRLENLDLDTQVYVDMRDEPNGYWVLIPPQPNKEMAVEVVKQLREAGVSDLWRFTSGTFTNAISLGLFNRESRAERRRQAIAAKGFEPEVRPRLRPKTVYWLEFVSSEDTTLSDATWNQLVEDYPALEQHRVDCTETVPAYMQPATPN